MLAFQLPFQVLFAAGRLTASVSVIGRKFLHFVLLSFVLTSFHFLVSSLECSPPITVAEVTYAVQIQKAVLYQNGTITCMVEQHEHLTNTLEVRCIGHRLL